MHAQAKISPNPPLPLDGVEASPAAVFRAMPAERPIGALWSAADGSAWSRWSVFACLGESAGAITPAMQRAFEVGSGAAVGDCMPPIGGGWIGWLSYDLGRLLEPAVERGGGVRAATDRAWPAMHWARIVAGLVHDAQTGRWWAVGDDEHERRRLAAHVRSRVGEASPAAGARSFALASAQPLDASRERYVAAVRRTLEHIVAGDIYQANIAHRLSFDFRGSARALMARLAETSGPWFGFYAEGVAGDAGGGSSAAVAGASPELFLRVERAGASPREVTTRPMKGTRPLHADAAELLGNEKERAELTMIVDLMRNDLGRACAGGSVRVDSLREVERHGHAAGGGGGVLQATATIRGDLSPGISLDALLRATFPPGSVTGAPKIRAMQIIDQLEAGRRGPYCGAMGLLGDDGALMLNVAIRTALIQGKSDAAAPGVFERATLDWSVGAGIVHDSDPEAEWRETLLKAAGILRLVAPFARGPGA